MTADVLDTDAVRLTQATEIERLREALQAIQRATKDPRSYIQRPKAAGCDTIYRVNALASEALGERSA